MRCTYKYLRSLVEEVNEKRNTDMTIFPNMYGYGIAQRGGYMSNYFNGKASECEAFLKGMLCEPIKKS